MLNSRLADLVTIFLFVLICIQVRSLESTIHGLEHTIAVGQGAGLEELSEAYMRSEVCKLQQEMDQLVHGTPAQVTQKMVIYLHTNTHLLLYW